MAIITKRKEIAIRKSEYIHDDEYYYKILRKNIRKYRIKKNLTQQELADMTGLSREYICDIENDSRNKHPSVSTIGRVVDALKVEMCEIFKEK